MNTLAYNYVLENQAWLLFKRLRWLLEHDYTVTSTKRTRLSQLLNRSYVRYERRQEKFYYNPGGFAPSSAQPSGVVGQGTTIDGRHFEVECFECDSPTCLNCDTYKLGAHS